jgi:hypothetical protein
MAIFGGHYLFYGGRIPHGKLHLATYFDALKRMLTLLVLLFFFFRNLHKKNV